MMSPRGSLSDLLFPRLSTTLSAKLSRRSKLKLRLGQLGPCNAEICGGVLGESIGG